MDNGNRLLDYVEMLDSFLPVGGFTYTASLDSKLSEGTIHNRDELEQYMQQQLPLHLITTEGYAIKEIYTAAAKEDLDAIVRINRSLSGTDRSLDQEAYERRASKRLFKLAKALYPWLDLEDLEQSVLQHNGVVYLSTLHGWINHQLSISCDRAVYTYMQSVVSSCVRCAAKKLPFTSQEGKVMVQQLLKELEQEWEMAKEASQNVFSPQTAGSRSA